MPEARRLPLAASYKLRGALGGYKLQAASCKLSEAWSLDPGAESWSLKPEAWSREAFAGRRARRREGFTLIELLVVITILAIAAATVALSVPAGDSRLLREETARLAALFRIAQDESRVSGRALVWEADLQGYRFRPLNAAAAPDWSDDVLRPRPWPFTVLRIEGGTIVFGREPLLDAATLRIVTADREARLALDALGNLSLLNQ